MDAEAVRQTGRTLQGCTGTAQDLCLLFKVSIKTLQRYRAIGALPYFTISGKVYYKASDVREFIKERFSVTTLRQFEKEHCTKKKK